MTDFLEREQTRLNARGSALPNYGKHPKCHLVISSEREYEFGWIFFWCAKEFLEGNDNCALGGNAPLIVDRINGQLYITGTAHRLEYYIELYRKGLRCRVGGKTLLLVREVRDTQLALNLLSQFCFTEAKTDFAHGVQWRIPERLTIEELESRLKYLPCKLGPINVDSMAQIEWLQKLSTSGTVRYDLLDESEIT